jgi:hypothetical protein
MSATTYVARWSISQKARRREGVVQAGAVDQIRKSWSDSLVEMALNDWKVIGLIEI